MNSLADTQAALWAAVRGRGVAPAHLAHYRGGGALSAEQRLDIYRRAYWARLVNALRALFPQVVAVLGDERFAQLASRSVNAHPTSEWAVEETGRAFVAYLDSVDDDPGKRVSGLSRLEWAMWEVFVAPDVAPLTLEAMRAQPLVGRRLRRGPHVRAVHLSAEAATSAGVAMGGATSAGPVALAVWRVGYDVSLRVVPASVAAALELANAGVVFEQWCDALSATHEPVALAQELTVWVERGWLVDASGGP